MSQSETDPFLKFGNMLLAAKSVFLEDKHRIIDVKQSDGKMHCVARFTISTLTVSKKVYLRWFFGSNDFLLRRLGFSNKKASKKFACTEPDCYRICRSIYSLANHLHVRHKISVHQCGKIVLALRDDKRPIPKGIHFIILHDKKVLEKVIYFFRN
ncbi:MAG: hypothetical protein KGI08_07600 [Thaumarchaeota archaeon]|nr:hypothetical protein [Nitrososphaerota archaeon]